MRAFYVFVCHRSLLSTVVDILADVLRNSKLDSSVVESERQQLLAALEEAGDDHFGVVMDNLHGAAFQGTSLARSPLGTTQSIKVHMLYFLSRGFFWVIWSQI